MIKYYCNRCKNEIPSGEVHQLTVATKESKRSVHFCGGCMKLFDKWVADYKEDAGDVTCIEVSGGGVVLTPEEPKTAPVVKPPLANVETLGRGLSEEQIADAMSVITYTDTFIDMEPIPESVCNKFFTQDFCSFGPRADIFTNTRCILLFYRGTSLSGIIKKYRLGNMQLLNGKLMNHVALYVYKRWFAPVPDFGIEARKVAELLAYLTGSWTVKDCMSEVGLDYDSQDDRNTLFAILEYYIGFGFTELQKQKFLGEV